MGSILRKNKKTDIITKEELEIIKEKINFYNEKCKLIINKDKKTKKDMEDLIYYGKEFKKLRKRIFSILKKGLKHSKNGIS